MRQPQPTRVAAVGAHDAVLADRRLPQQHDVGQKLHVGGDLHLGADVGRGRIPHRDAGGHVRVVDAPLHDAGRLGQLAARVHAQALLRIARLIGEHGPPGGAADGQHVGKIELALGVVGIHLGKRVEKGAGVEAVDARVALGDGRFLGARVLLLDDAGHLPGAVAHDATVAEGVFKLHGKHDDRRVVLLAQSRHLANGLGLNERRVAGEHHDGAVEAGQGIGGGQHRIRRAALGLLHDDLGIAFHQRDHLVAHMPHHGDDPIGARLLGRFHDPPHERAAQHLVNHLRLLRLHTGTGPRGQNNRSSFHETPFYSYTCARSRPFPIGLV